MEAKDVIRIAESISLNYANRSDESTLIEFAEAIAAAEREACAKVCEGLDDGKIGGWYECASAIRARSNA